MSKKSYRVGIPAHSFIDWMGGYDFVRSLTESLISADDRGCEFFLILPIKGFRATAIEYLRRLRNAAKGIQRSYPSRKNIYEVAKLTFNSKIKIALIDVGDSSLNNFCKKNNIDVLIPAAKPFSRKIKIKWIGWIGDFQHKHLPNFFSDKEIKDRDNFFRKMLNEAQSIIVNSKNIASEVSEFYPGHDVRIYSMPFSASYPGVELENVGKILEKYAIHEKYFMCSNQFWMHKDHETLFKAFSLVSKENPDVMLVCTGELRDPRDGKYISKLMHLIEDLELTEKIKFLGLIPKVDQLTLMSSCIALIQPSLSEGGPGGGAVFDAIGLGINCIISDIQVNKEIKEEGATFFLQRNPKSLFSEMKKLINIPSRAVHINELLIKSFERKQKCGNLLFSAIDELLK